MVVVSSTAKAMLLPFPSSSQLRLWFLLTERLLEGRGVSDTSLAAWILCPEVFGALVVWRRLQEDVGFEEGLFLWMSLVHRLLRALAHVSFFCKMWLRTFSIYAGVFRGGGGGFRRGVRAVKRRFAERGGLWLLQNVCSYVFLEIILALGAGFKPFVGGGARDCPSAARNLSTFTAASPCSWPLPTASSTTASSWPA